MSMLGTRWEWEWLEWKWLEPGWLEWEWLEPEWLEWEWLAKPGWLEWEWLAKPGDFNNPRQKMSITDLTTHRFNNTQIDR